MGGLFLLDPRVRWDGMLRPRFRAHMLRPRELVRHGAPDGCDGGVVGYKGEYLDAVDVYAYG